MQQLDELKSLLNCYRFRFSTERLLQDDLETILEMNSCDYSREENLQAEGGLDRPDFLCKTAGACIAVECKIAGGPGPVLAQLIRYAQHDQIDAVLLVTSRRTHRFDVEKLNDKPFAVLWVAGGAI